VLKKSLIVAAAVAPVVVVSAVAQQSSIKLTPLQTVDFPPGYNVMSAIVEFPAGICEDRHAHPGVGIAYVMEGATVLKIDGKPDQTLKAGDSFQVPPSAVHLNCTAPGQAVKILVNLIIEKGKPMSSPAP
jgi:quercetin dioxygenase-like cupin family protein